VLTQGEGSRDALLREFRERGNAVLLGTGSFWEGVDVKGDALSLVVIDKLPFASPTTRSWARVSRASAAAAGIPSTSIRSRRQCWRSSRASAA